MKRVAIIASIFLLQVVLQVTANACAGLNKDFAPDATNCTNYYYCDNGQVVALNSCPWNQLYEREKKICDYPENVKNCLAPPPPPVESCPPTGVAKIPIPGDCVNYFICVDGERSNRQCSEETLFDTEKRNCELAKNAVCNDCPLVDVPGELVFKPNRQDCTKYFLCKNREQIPLQ